MFRLKVRKKKPTVDSAVFRDTMSLLVLDMTDVAKTWTNSLRVANQLKIKDLISQCRAG
jgi:hypothetical protein